MLKVIQEFEGVSKTKTDEQGNPKKYKFYKVTDLNGKVTMEKGIPTRASTLAILNGLTVGDTFPGSLEWNETEERYDITIPEEVAA